MPPNQRKPDRPRVQFVCSEQLASTLQEWADRDNRSRSNLIETLLEEVVSDRNNPHSLPTNELIDQITKFIALLLGERERDGVSYVLLGQTLSIDPEKLHDLYQLVQQCRSERQNKEKTR